MSNYAPLRIFAFPIVPLVVQMWYKNNQNI